MELASFTFGCAVLMSAVSVCNGDEQAFPLHHADTVSRAKRDDTSGWPRLRIATIVHEPFVKRSNNSMKTFEGFIPDLISMIATKAKFNYEFFEVDKYGTIDGNGNWNGMIGAILAKESGNTSGADLAAADLTITATRRKAVDFAHPFQDLGLSIVIQKPHFNVKSYTVDLVDFDPYGFTVLSPMTFEVWAFITLCVLGVACSLWAYNKFNPYEWEGMYNRGFATREEGDNMNLPSSFWFVFSTLQWQGFDKPPKSIAGRVLTIFWFIFVTIVIITYTAGIVNSLFFASLVHERDPLFHRFHSLEELVMQKSDYKYGVIRGGSSYSYLMNVASGAEYDVIRNYLRSDEGQRNLVNSVEEGLAKVRTGDFAYILESPVAKYYTNKMPCDLMTVGPPFGLRNFGMAVAKNSPWLEKLDSAVLEIRESGAMENLENRWFRGERQCWNVTTIENLARKSLSLDINKPKKIDMRIFWGPLVLIICGIVIGALICLAEVLWYKFRGRYSPSNRPPGRVLQPDDDNQTF